MYVILFARDKGLSGSGNNNELSCVFSNTVFAVPTLPYREVSSTSASPNRTVLLLKAIESMSFIWNVTSKVEHSPDVAPPVKFAENTGRSVIPEST